MYWSSTTNDVFTSNAWTVGMDNAVGSQLKWEGHECNYLWPVRTGQPGMIALPKTGQVKCYEETGEEKSCSGTGQDGEIQAGANRPTPRFSVIGDCAIDNLTGLTWVKSPDSTLRNWQEALTHANGLTLCGYSDWRLPNIKELRSLVDYGRSSPALPEGHPFTNVASDYYWSSTTDPFHPAYAWVVHFNAGDVEWNNPKGGATYYVWPVRLGAAQVEGLSVTPPSKNFGTVAPGTTSPSQTFTVTNVGTGSVTVTDASVTGTDSTQFAEVAGSDQCTGQALTPGAQCTVQVLFSPTTTGSKTAELTITSTSGTNPTLHVPLKGTGGTPGGAGAIELPQTGQTTCYDVNIPYTSVSCSGTGQDGQIQAGVPWPDPRFTVGTDAESDCIFDNLTGLMWARSASLPKTWDQAVTYANSFNLCGHSDWRIPNVNEMESLLTMEGSQQISIWLNSQGFIGIEPTVPWPDAPAAPPYWTSTYYPWHDGSTFHAFYLSTGLALPWGRGGEACVLPVRQATTGAVRLPWTGQSKCFRDAYDEIPCAGTGQDGESQTGVAWPVPRFVDHGDGRVTDRLTGLMWTKDADSPGPSACSPGGTRDWPDALDYVSCLNVNNYLGHNDWRLPNRNEMRSLIDYSQSNPALQSGHPFGNPLEGGTSFWTSTATVTIYTVLFDIGVAKQMLNLHLGVYDTTWSTDMLRAWPVRTAEVSPGVSDIDLSLSSHDFGLVNVGFTASQELRISNTGTADLTVTGIAIDGPDKAMFNINSGGSNPCTSYTPTIAPGGNCTILMTFTPGSAGAKSATMPISSNDPDENPKNVALSGTGGAVAQPDIEISPTPPIIMENAYVGSFSDKTIEVKNVGLADLILGTIEGPGAPFSRLAGGTCTNGMTIVPDGSCTILVRFTPPAANAYLSGITITSNDPDESPLVVELNGSGFTPPLYPDIDVSPGSHNFGSVNVGSSATQPFTISNTGTGDLILAFPAYITGGDEGMFSVATGGAKPCASLQPTIPAGGNCTVSVTFSPTSAGAKSSTLRFQSNDLDEPTKDIPLSGAGAVVAQPDIDVNPTTHNFGSVNVGSSANQQFTVSNTGGAALNVTGIAMTGGDAGMFSVASGGTNPCGSLTPIIGAGGNCTVIATFSPTSPGAKSTTMRIVSDDPDENPKDVVLNGTGVSFSVTPKEGTYGTDVLIEGNEFGSKKGKVLIGSAAVKVSEWKPSTIKGTLNKAMPPELYDVTIERKDPKGAPPLTEEDAFTVKPPEIDEILPAAEGTAGEEITIKGWFFGTKKGKVYLAGKSCKVVSWQMIEIKFVVPKKLPTGKQELKVVNGVGEDTASFTVE